MDGRSVVELVEKAFVKFVIFVGFAGSEQRNDIIATDFFLSRCGEGAENEEEIVLNFSMADTYSANWASFGSRDRLIDAIQVEMMATLQRCALPLVIIQANHAA